MNALSATDADSSITEDAFVQLVIAQLRYCLLSERLMYKSSAVAVCLPNALMRGIKPSRLTQFHLYAYVLCSRKDLNEIESNTSTKPGA